MRSIVLSLWFFAASMAYATPADTSVTKQDAQAQSAKAFVQGFYDWYTGWTSPHYDANKDHAVGPEPEEARNNKRWPMSPAIKTALQEDSEAEDKSPGVIVGIDFDPYLNAQDTCYPCKTGKVTQAGALYRVEVFASNCADLKSGQPIVIAEIEQQKGSWVFVNFIYPGDPGQADSDLLSTLKALKEDREQHPDQDPNRN